MLWSGREVARKIFDKKTEKEILAMLQALRVQAKAKKIEAVMIGKNYWYVTDGIQIFQKEKQKKVEVGRLVRK